MASFDFTTLILGLSEESWYLQEKSTNRKEMYFRHFDIVLTVSILSTKDQTQTPQTPSYPPDFRHYQDYS